MANQHEIVLDVHQQMRTANVAQVRTNLAMAQVLVTTELLLEAANVNVLLDRTAVSQVSYQLVR